MRRICSSKVHCTVPLCALSKRSAASGANESLLSDIRSGELIALWGSDPGAPEQGYQHWLELGFDPAVDTAASAPSQHWSLEDGMGTNLCCTESLLHSRHLWSQFSKELYGGRLRHARGPSSQTVGLASARQTAKDEADRPEAEWSQDVDFQKMAQLCKLHLDTPVSTMEQVDLAIRRAEPEKFAEFFADLAATDPLRLPLPTAAGFHYEGDQKLEWAKRFQSAFLEGQAIRRSLADAADAKKWPDVAKELAGAMKAIADLRLKRFERQVKEGLAKPWNAVSANEKYSFCYYQCELEYKGIVEGEIDPEDTNDKSEGWLQEQEAIAAEANKVLGSCGQSYLSVWMNTTRLLGLELEHLHSTHEYRLIAAKARVRALDEANGEFGVIDAALVESAEHSSYDPRAEVLVPHMNGNWLKWHWATFGAATQVHHTASGSHELLFHNASLLRSQTLAQAFFQLRPLSTALDYGSPYKYRQSVLHICGEVGIAEMIDLHEPNLRPLVHLKHAEKDLHAVAAAARWEYGAKRRAVINAQRTAAKLLPVQKVEVLEEGENAKPIAKWGIGTAHTVGYKWSSPHHDENLAATTARLQGMSDEESSLVGVEVTLWRKLDGGAKVAVPPAVQQGVDLCQKDPVLQKAYQRTLEQCAVLCPLPAMSEQTAADPNAGWEYVTVLHDRCPYTEEGQVSVTLPRTAVGMNGQPGLPIPTEGTYRLRVRMYDHLVNPKHLPEMCAEGFSNEFALEDTLQKVETAFFNKDQLPETFPGDDLIKYFDALKVAGIEFPFALEFQAGQALTAHGEVCLGYIHQLMEDPKYSIGVSVLEDLTSPQLEAEAKIRAHWELYNPGATDEEWFAARRAVLDAAFSEELSWWSDLDADDSQFEGLLDFNNMPQIMRSHRDKVQVLSASGTSNARESIDSPAASCRLRGDGLLEQFQINQHVCREEKLEFDTVLKSARDAINNAHNRVNTLSMAKTGGWDKLVSATQIKRHSASLFGGVMGPTTLFAYQKAVDELGLTFPDPREEEVDRMPSEIPELRRKYIGGPTQNRTGGNAEMPPQYQLNWKA